MSDIQKKGPSLGVKQRTGRRSVKTGRLYFGSGDSLGVWGDPHPGGTYPMTKRKAPDGGRPKTLGVSNSWLVYFMETPIKMDDLGVFHGTPISGNLPYDLIKYVVR